ncbi:MAG: altronate dehydratase family protein, partial [Lachnospiraceae bacterium]|nr:altronate dehydratase family protein [Lachnospiraceae bacterium]
EVTTVMEIPAGHKFALADLAEGVPVIKYGFSIGNTTAAVKKGEWIHTHNLKTGLGDLLEYSYEPDPIEEKFTEDATFMGYRRKNGRAGVRNEIWIIPTVGCVNNVASRIAELSKGLVRENIEAVCAFPHPYGCSQMGDDQEHTRQILANLIDHPNAGGVLVLGLGCENSNIDVLKGYLGEIDPDRVKFLVAQESDDEIAEGVGIVKGLAEYAAQFQREPISVSELVIGMKCGGSDGFSGITANPAVGRFSDILISKKGTTILTEVPEMFGAETILMNRCANEALFDKTVDLINDFKNYFKRHNQTIYENPSPGNKKGGISTLEDKSLGCTQKSGSAVVKGVLAYGETVSTPGLNLLSAPGNDLVAATALAASGAHMVLFTTGRGTPFACPVPTVKISSNSRLAGKKDNWIDFNAGVVAEGESLDVAGQRLFDEVVAVASGKQVKSELAGFHDMAIFKQGVTL